MVEIVQRTRERRKVQTAVHTSLNFERPAYIPLTKLERRIALKMFDVLAGPRYQIVNTEHMMAFLNQAIT